MEQAATFPVVHPAAPEEPSRGNRDRSRSLVPLRSLRRSRALRAIYVRAFRTIQALGFSITPVHFYFPVPDLNRLSPQMWPGGPGESVVNFDTPAQLARLQRWRQFSHEWDFDEKPCAEEHRFHINNGFFETVDAEVAYSIVREAKPRCIIEVGAGNSTRLLASALRKNAEEGAPGELVSIEPHPDELLRRGFPGLSKLIATPVQNVPPEFFERLGANDILFLDSSHVVALGSDVVYEILEILPRLKTGVLIHFHDIFIPAEYPRKFVMNNLCFWGEQYMLQAFLCGNRQFRIVWSSSMMQLAHSRLLRSVFPRWQGSYKHMPDALKAFTPTFDDQNVWPCSLWLKKCE
jgi:hypothetical protein